MRGADLIAAARRRIEARLGLPTKLEAVDESIWIKVDSYSLMQGITYLVSRLREEFGIREVRFGSRPPARSRISTSSGPARRSGLGDHDGVADRFAGIGRRGEPAHAEADRRAPQRRDLVPDPQAVAARISSASRCRSPGPRRRRGAPRHAPRAGPSSTTSTSSTSRDRRPSSTAGRSRALSYTVFDTETTGLQPSAGDEIVSIGAVRIVNGRLLEHEVFEQLVDPQRAMSPEAARITGIDDGDAREPADDRPACCPRSANSARTRCSSRTTRRSTCASCASRRRRPASASRSRSWTRCCCRR